MSYKMGRVGDLKVGSYAIIDDEPSQIASLQKSKSGKHGSAKFRCSAISLLTVARGVLSVLFPPPSRYP